MAKIPHFATLEEAARFWDTHDFEDYVDDTRAATLAVNSSQQEATLSVPVPLGVYERIEALAAQRNMSVEKLVRAWLEEKALEASRE